MAKKVTIKKETKKADKPQTVIIGRVILTKNPKQK